MLHYLATPSYLLGTLVAVSIGLDGHNLAQAWVARLLGDRLPAREGMTGFTWRQLDVLGVVTAFLTAFAWSFAAPVPIEERRRRTQAVVALLAGPVFLIALTIGLSEGYRALPDPGAFDGKVLFAATVSAAGTFVVSMLPFPPLALGRALWMFAPPTGGWATARYRLEQENLGRLLAFAVLILPLLLSAIPSIVGEFVDPLLRSLQVTS